MIRASGRLPRRLQQEVDRQLSLLAGCPGHAAHEGFVYVLRQRGREGYVKIGKTTDLAKRVGDHQSGAARRIPGLAA
jgi:hypothetical protein